MLENSALMQVLVLFPQFCRSAEGQPTEEQAKLPLAIRERDLDYQVGAMATCAQIHIVLQICLHFVPAFVLALKVVAFETRLPLPPRLRAGKEPC